MADKKLVTLYTAKSGTKVQVSEEDAKKLKERGFTTTEPKPILGKA